MKKTRFIALAVLMIIILSFASCSSKKAPEGMTGLEGDNLTYNIYVPSTWDAALSGGSVSAYLPADMSNISLVTITPPASTDDEGTATPIYTDVNDLWENGYKVSLSYTFSKLEYTEETESAIGGESCLKVGYTVKTFDITTKAEQSYTVLQLLFAHSDNYYVLTYTALSDKFDSHMSDVSSIISNFSFK